MTIVASVRPNPLYAGAVSQFLANMGKIANDGAMARARIWADEGHEISRTITQSHQAQQAVQDRGEYLLSDSPGCDPGVVLQENWTQLKKAR